MTMTSQKGQKKFKGKVFVGLSGGVDSSVSAALLQKAGFDVTGVFIKVWQPDWIECTWKEDRLDAMRVCAKLNISFIELNLEKEYKKEVVDYMIEEYKKGNTPNPDVMCNRYVKFGGFYNWAMENGAQFVATGHYAKISKNETKEFVMVAGSDTNKDQSYFLWQLKKEQLSHILFPVGDLEKPEVRKLAKKFDLVTADKKDSQGLCFIGKIDMKDFLKSFIESKEGDVLDENGKVVGKHDGAMFFTLGERHGFSILEKQTNQLPYYVISKDVSKNTITVSHKQSETDLEKVVTKIKIKNTNWLANPNLNSENKYTARSRYRQPLQKVIIEKKQNDYFVIFAEPQNYITPGQSIVFYEGDVCLGGGIIETVTN